MSKMNATVDAASAYRSIISNFSNPLEFVREAISNSIDASAKDIFIAVERLRGPNGQNEIVITLQDDGCGMDEIGLGRFFNLCDSEKYVIKSESNEDVSVIGEKGLGTKIYLNSRKVEVHTISKGGIRLEAISEGHLERIHTNKQPPQYEIIIRQTTDTLSTGTTIKIFGYNRNEGSQLGHEQLLDYVLWFTKFGSIESSLWTTLDRYKKEKEKLSSINLKLMGLGFKGTRYSMNDESATYESISFGHLFPEEFYDKNQLRARARREKANPTDLYCRRFVKDGQLEKFSDVRWQAVFSIEGNRVKYANPMVRRQGYKAPPGAYKVAERYGIWVCKDFIPVERVNSLFPGKGNEFLKFHAFFNCQAIQLSADRTSIGPTPPDIREAINYQIKDIIREILEDDGVAKLLANLDEEQFGERTTEQEKKDYARRIKQAKSIKSVVYKSSELRVPQMELGVVAMLAQLLVIDPDIFPFRILDWNNSAGIDCLARDTTDLSFDDADKFYVECKFHLTNSFNHSLANVRYIVCWNTDLVNGDKVTAVGGDTRNMVIEINETKHKRFYLSQPNAINNIEVFVLHQLLVERLGVVF